MGIRDRIANTLGLRRNPVYPVTKVGLAELTAARSGFATSVPSSPAEYAQYFQTSTPVFRAIHLRAEAVSSAPIRVMDIAADDTFTPSGIADPTQKLLTSVNRWWTSSDLFYATEVQLSVWGASFWYVDKETDPSNPTIWPLSPARMKVVPAQTGTDYIEGFLYKGEAGKKDTAFLPDEIIWFRRYNPMNEFEPASPLAPGRASFDMGTDATLYNRNFFRNNAMPSDVVFYSNDPISQEQYEDFMARLDERYRGTAKAHRPLLWDLSAGQKPERLGLSQKDMEFMAALQWTVTDAARVFGVMPPLMMDTTASTLDNVKQARIEFYTSTVMAEWQFIANEINELLLPVLGAENQKVEFDTTNIVTLQQARMEDRAQRLTEVEKGTLTINEYREAEGLVPVDWGDAWWTQANMIAVEGIPEEPEDDTEGDGDGPFGGNDDDDRDDEETIPFFSFDALTGKKFKRPQHSSNGKMPEWPLKQVEAWWKANDEFVERHAADFSLMQRKLFNAQLNDVLDKLANTKLPPPTTGMPVSDIIQREIGETIFNPTQWVPLFERRGRRLMAIALSASGRQTTDEFNLPPFRPGTPSADKWLDNRAAFWADRVNIETGKLINSEMVAGLKNGESIADLQKRVKKVFRFSSTTRTEMIARTETVAAAGAGQEEAYARTDVVAKKQWIATIDDRVRDEHIDAHLQVVPKESAFDVGGEKLTSPGNGGSAWNVINCRCTTVPILRNQRAAVVPLRRERETRV
jgi:HK97 family phage portal protein